MKKTIMALSILILVLMATGAYGTYAKQINKQPFLSQRIQEADFTGFYLDVTRQMPTLGNPDEGSIDAPIILLAYLDPMDSASASFAERYASIRERLVRNGTVRFYGRVPLTKEELDGHSERFLYAQALACVKALRPTAYVDAYFGVMGKPLKSVPEVIAELRIPVEEYNDCVHNKEFPEFKEDVALTERGMTFIGQVLMVGYGEGTMTVFNGIPSQTRIDRAIKQFLMGIGA